MENNQLATVSNADWIEGFKNGIAAGLVLAVIVCFIAAIIFE